MKLGRAFRSLLLSWISLLCPAGNTMFIKVSLCTSLGPLAFWGLPSLPHFSPPPLLLTFCHLGVSLPLKMVYGGLASSSSLSLGGSCRKEELGWWSLPGLSHGLDLRRDRLVCAKCFGKHYATSSKGKLIIFHSSLSLPVLSPHSPLFLSSLLCSLCVLLTSVLFATCSLLCS